MKGYITVDAAPSRLRRALALLLALGLTLGACGSADTGTSNPDAFSVQGTIEFLELEGGCWSILAPDSTRYEPVDVSDQFRHHGLRIRATIKLRTDLGSFCMIGPIVEILSIERR